MGRRCPGGASALLFLTAGALAAWLPAGAAWGAQTTTATVVLVHNGDTLVVELAEGVRTTVHLLGVAAPSLRDVRPRGAQKAMGQPFAEEARRALEDLVLGKQVRVFFYGRDSFRQVRGEVFLAGENVNAHILRAGLARVDRSAQHVPEALRQTLERAEGEAKREKRGLWIFE